MQEPTSKDTNSTVAERGINPVRKDAVKLENQDGPTRDDAVLQGQKDAKTNHKAERAESTSDGSQTLEDVVKDAQKTARNNHKAEQKNAKLEQEKTDKLASERNSDRKS